MLMHVLELIVAPATHVIDQVLKLMQILAYVSSKIKTRWSLMISNHNHYQSMGMKQANLRYRHADLIPYLENMLKMTT